MNSNKTLGILLLLIFVCVSTALLNDAFIRPYNLQNLLRSSSMFAIIGIGAVMVIVTGGIDLSTGSLIGLVGCTLTMTLKSFSQHPPADNGAWLIWLVGIELLSVSLGWMLWDWLIRKKKPWQQSKWKFTALVCGGVLLGLSMMVAGMQFGPWLTMAVAVAVALLLSAHLGLMHGLLITKLNLQPFVVTLCFLMQYRGLSRYFTRDKTQGLGTDYEDSLRLMAIGKPCTATAVILMCSLGLILFGIWKSILSKRSRSDSQARTNGLMMLVIGLVLAFVSSSRYWDGWQVDSGDSFAEIAGAELRFFTVDVPDQAVARPARLMSLAFYPLIACFAGLGLWAGSLNWRDRATTFGRKLLNTMPLLFVAVSIVWLLATNHWIDGQTISLSDMSTAFQANVSDGADDRFILGINVILVKMLSVFLSMAVLMGGILWLGKGWTKSTGNVGRALWTLSGFFAVLWLLGKTDIHQTVVQTPFFFLLVIGAVAAVFLNMTVYGRYFFALGNNQEAARYSGINTDNVKILAYVLCALCGGIGSVLFTLDSNNVEPSGHGSFYELYAIAAAVLGGCSLRGGEGSIIGVIIGASIMRVLYNAPDMIGVASQLEMFTIGFVLLIGVIVDESARRIAAKRERSLI